MTIEWLPIFISAVASGLLSLVISHVYYRVTGRNAEVHHDHQMRAAAERHDEQMSRMETHHAEQVLVLRTTLLAVEKDSGVEAARDTQGNLTGGVHHHGRFTAAPEVSAAVIEDAAERTADATDRDTKEPIVKR
jgi:hypothetical protein